MKSKEIPTKEGVTVYHTQGERFLLLDILAYLITYLAKEKDSGFLRQVLVSLFKMSTSNEDDLYVQVVLVACH